jgi:predicted permease
LVTSFLSVFVLRFFLPPDKPQAGHLGLSPKACVIYTNNNYIMGFAFWQENLFISQFCGYAKFI